jgi:mono/diheme cytochrome c family protein
MYRMIARIGLLAVVTVSVAAPALAQNAAMVERGQKVYTAEKCSVCHSIGGTGNKRGALDGVGSKLSEDQVRQWIIAAPEMTAKMKADRKPVMKSYSHLPKDDIEALVAYMMSLKK